MEYLPVPIILYTFFLTCTARCELLRNCNSLSMPNSDIHLTFPMTLDAYRHIDSCVLWVVKMMKK